MFLQQLINGITIGSTYALVAIGYSMVFGVLELINFANGAVYMLGGYLTLMLYTGLVGNFGLAFALGILLTGVIGYGIDRFGLRRLREKKVPKITGLITTLGISTVIENAVRIFFGSETKPYPNKIDFGQITLGSVTITSSQLIILLVSILLMTITSLMVYKSKMGKAMLAISQSQEASQLMGINVNAVISLTFIISSALAAIAGTLVGMYYQNIDASMGFSVGMKTLASAVLGGVGVLPGAMAGGVLMGVFETLGASYVSSGYRDAISFAILIIVILFKPSGLFGRKQITKV